MDKKNKKNGFTLPELIVTVIILTILGIISSISLQGYTLKARDMVRISDISSIKKSLSLYVIKKGKYPKPSNETSITYSGVELWSQGTFGNSMFDNIKIISRKPLDPLTNNEYTYSLSNDGYEYEISGIIESNDSQSINFIENIHALGNKNLKAYVKGNYNGLVNKINIGGRDFVLAMPSITSNDINTTDIETIINEQKLVYGNYGNLPDSYKGSALNINGGFNYNPNGLIVFSGSLKDLNEGANQLIFLKNLQNSYYGSELINDDPTIAKIVNFDVNLGNPSDIAKVLACNIINFKLKYFVECNGLDFITFYITNILHIDITNLPGSKILSIFQDPSNGNLWFGTNDGVAKLSGGNWTIYQKNSHDNNSLINNNVTSITKDNSGNFWFGTVNGISKFDGVDTWVTYSHDILVSTHIQYIYTSPDGTIWIGTNGGVSTYDSDVWDDYTKKNTGLSANNITAIFEDNNNNIWFGTNSKGVDKYFNGEVTNYTTPNLINNDISYIFQDNDDNIWFGTKGGLSRFLSDGTTWESFTVSNTSSKLPNDSITYIYQDNNDNLWFGTKNGVVKVSNNMLTWRKYDTSDGITGSEIHSIYQDEDFNVLILSNGGINTIDSNGDIID